MTGVRTETFSQNQVVFTSTTNDTVHKFWRVNVDTPFVFDNISEKLDLIAPLQGNDFGPITVSHDGNWYAFTSQRFDVDAQGWAALTITNSDFTSYEVVHDSSGQLIHSEGIAYVFNGGNGIVFVADFGNHNRDVFVIYKTGGNWGMPENLTFGSSYNYNYCPYLSADGAKILFDASSTSFPSTAIGEMNIDGNNLTFPIVASSMLNGIAAHSPCYGIDGSIIYEGDASGERIWRLPNGSLTPLLINATYGNDNSPVTLPDGRIASLWLPGSWHEIKIMNVDGTNGYMLTDNSSLFTEVFDIGISSGPSYLVGINDVNASEVLKIFPNPSNGVFQYYLSNKLRTTDIIEIYNILGEKVLNETRMSSDFSIHKISDNQANKIDISTYPKGIYIVKIIAGVKIYTEKIVVQ